MGLLKFLIGFAFVAIFAIAIVTYSIGFSTDNQADININTEGELSGLKTNIQTDVEAFKGSADTSASIFLEASIAPGDENVEGGGQFKTGPTNILSTTGNILSSTTEVIFGGKGSGFGIITTTILAFLGFIVWAYAWKAWKGGAVD